MFCPTKLKLVCELETHTCKRRQAFTCTDTRWTLSPKPAEARNKGNKIGQNGQRKDYSWEILGLTAILVLFLVLGRKEPKCVSGWLITVLPWFYTLCVCPGLDWAPNTVTSPLWSALWLYLTWQRFTWIFFFQWNCSRSHMFPSMCTDCWILFSVLSYYWHCHCFRFNFYLGKCHTRWSQELPWKLVGKTLLLGNIKEENTHIQFCVA